MLEQQLIKLLLSRDFYLSNRDRISPNFFEGELKSLFETTITAQEKYQHDLTLDELKALYFTTNPTLSRAARNNVENIFLDLEGLDGLSEDVGADVLEGLWKRETFRQIAEIGLKGVEGEILDLEGVREIVSRRADSFLPTDEVDFVPNDLDELLQINATANRFKINIPSVAEKLPGTAGGEFGIIFARPETGKTASYVSLTCAPGGYAWQGHRTLILCNEEPGRRTLLRCVTAACQKPKAWVDANRKEARGIWDKIKDNVILGDAVGLSITRLDALVRKHEPAVVIVDQLDKVGIGGNFAATHEKLRALYTQAREVAKKHDCFLWAISQASAEAEGKTILQPVMMEGSKTGKFAESDVILGIGKYPHQEGSVEEDFTRVWTIGKNKISSWHGSIYTVLDAETSTYRS
jgi:hypothetical protein